MQSYSTIHLILFKNTIHALQIVPCIKDSKQLLNMKYLEDWMSKLDDCSYPTYAFQLT